MLWLSTSTSSNQQALQGTRDKNATGSNIAKKYRGNQKADGIPQQQILRLRAKPNYVNKGWALVSHNANQFALENRGVIQATERITVRANWKLWNENQWETMQANNFRKTISSSIPALSARIYTSCRIFQMHCGLVKTDNTTKRHGTHNMQVWGVWVNFLRVTNARILVTTTARHIRASPQHTHLSIWLF